MVRRPRIKTTPPPDVDFIVTVRDGGVVELWTRSGMPGAELARRLRVIADGFESGDDVERIR